MTKGRKSIFLALIPLFLVAAALDVSLGPLHIPFSRIIPESWEYLNGSRGGEAVVLGAIRWPRLVAAAVVGAGLAGTGAVLQAVFRNPMADPAIIGVSSGASLGAVLTIQLGLSNLNAWSTPIGSFLSGLVVMILIYRLSTFKGRTVIHSLLLAGVAVGSFCSAMVTLMLSLVPLQTVKEILFWLIGGLGGVTWSTCLIAGAAVALGLAVFIKIAHALDVMTVGEEHAESVGVQLQRAKQLVFGASALIIGACVSISGVIGFVGLIIPHLMRFGVGSRHSLLIPASALGGSILLISCDLVARMSFAPVELNVGVVTSCLGAPFFLYLLRTQDRGGFVFNKKRLKRSGE